MVFFFGLVKPNKINILPSTADEVKCSVMHDVSTETEQKSSLAMQENRILLL